MLSLQLAGHASIFCMSEARAAAATGPLTDKYQVAVDGIWEFNKDPTI